VSDGALGDRCDKPGGLLRVERRGDVRPTLFRGNDLSDVVDALSAVDLDIERGAAEAPPYDPTALNGKPGAPAEGDAIADLHSAKPMKMIDTAKAVNAKKSKIARIGDSSVA
jgi:hypothetical protein